MSASTQMTVRPKLSLIPVFTFIALSLPLPAHADEEDAEKALARAEAKAELVVKTGAPATDTVAFNTAQRKIAASRDALERDKNRQAEWYAEEAEVWADVSATRGEVANLQQSRDELSRAVDILAVETSR